MILGTQTHLSTLTEYNRNHHKPYHTHSMSFFAFSFIYAIAYMPFFLYVHMPYLNTSQKKSSCKAYTFSCIRISSCDGLLNLNSKASSTISSYRTISLVYFVMENVQLSIHFGLFNWGFWWFGRIVVDWMIIDMV